MLELRREDYSVVAPALAPLSHAVPPFAVLGGNAPGRVFVDDARSPHIAFVWTHVNYAFLAGPVDNAEFNRSLGELLTSDLIPDAVCRGDSSFIIYPSSEKWLDPLAAMLPGRKLQKTFRRVFEFGEVPFAEARKDGACVPEGFRLLRYDRGLIERFEDRVAGGVRLGWSSIDAFLEKGLGYCALLGDDVASTCTSIFRAGDRVEIDVSTVPPYRRRGLATHTAGALIEHALSRGMSPNWECFADNAASNALAEKLGFEARTDWPVCCWEEA